MGGKPIHRLPAILKSGESQNRHKPLTAKHLRGVTSDSRLLTRFFPPLPSSYLFSSSPMPRKCEDGRWDSYAPHTSRPLGCHTLPTTEGQKDASNQTACWGRGARRRGSPPGGCVRRCPSPEPVRASASPALPAAPLRRGRPPGAAARRRAVPPLPLLPVERCPGPSRRRSCPCRPLPSSPGPIAPQPRPSTRASRCAGARVRAGPSASALGAKYSP